MPHSDAETSQGNLSGENKFDLSLHIGQIGPRGKAAQPSPARPNQSSDGLTDISGVLQQNEFSSLLNWNFELNKKENIQGRYAFKYK